MTMRMLIDARHREETRVAVVKGNRVEEFDFESAERKQLKGNIYLAKVTRVEPSLQAAFVDYGGNRHGFLAFSEIHPDYYQIPKEDREALLREEAEHAAEEEALRGDQDDDEPHDDEPHDDEDRGDEMAAQSERFDDGGAQEPGDAAEDAEHDHDGDAPPAPRSTGGRGEDNAVETLRQKRMNLRRRYKIQDVIRRRQVLLVQVVKEERGNKGAALTTYLSLAGRYCVLMPNTSHGGGISRKISSPADRKRLKSIMSDLQLPQSMGCIVRTAGLQRTKSEIKRDFDYLARLWDEIRENTLKSSAPALVHADSDLIKRAIRDIYNRDIDEVIVEGEEGFRLARSFMRLLMPSHAKKVQPYVDAVPLFQRFGVEDQLAAMYQPLVQLKSGGYLVINPTEALVSIDINSGRSTREHNIEQTALNTNLEAAGEIARQLRLRDMAGLVVIDFIDMESSGNVRKVEKAMKGALANDRARIQVGRISSFGLLEMSRQRLRTGVLEASTRICPHCEGTGLVRTASSAGLSALRMIEDEAARGRGSHICLRASQEAAFYVLNRKRGELAEIEDRYGVLIEVVPDGSMEGARMAVSSEGPPPAHAPRLPPPIVIDYDDDEDLPEEEDEIEEEAEEEAEPRAREERGDRPERTERAAGEEDRGDGRGRRRRRRRRRGGRDGAEGSEGGDGAPVSEEQIAEEDAADLAEATAEMAGEPAAESEEGRTARRGRRGRRGGRRRPSEGGEPRDVSADDAIVEAEAVPGEPDDGVAIDPGFGEPVATSDEQPEPAEAKPRARRRPRARRDDLATPVAAVSEEAVPEAISAELPAAEPVPDEPAPPAKPRRSRRKAEPAVDAEPAAAAAEPVAEDAAEPQDEATPRRRSRGKRTPEPAVMEQAVESEAAEAVTTAALADEVTVEAVAADGTEAPAGADDGDDTSGTPRRGWWQRTFGN